MTRSRKGAHLSNGAETPNPGPKFRVVAEEFVPDRPATVEPDDHAAATGFMLLALKALSQRALIALMGLETVALAATVFFLAYLISSTPTITQLVELGLYATFILLIARFRR